MKQFIIYLFAVSVLFAACKKSKDVVNLPESHPLTDFLYLPVKDAVWTIHTQGIIMLDVSYPCMENSKSGFDSAVHTYYTIRATGFDTVMDGKKYYFYTGNIKYKISSCPNNPRDRDVNQYLREDTAKQQVLMYGGMGQDQVIMDFSGEQPGDAAKTTPFWPKAYISNFNSLLINNQKVKMWEMTFDGKPHIKHFYKAYGIGGQMGFLPREWANYTEPVSIDFTYKGYTSHFDFPFYQNQNIEFGW